MKSKPKLYTSLYGALKFAHAGDHIDVITVCQGNFHKLWDFEFEHYSLPDCKLIIKRCPVSSIIGQQLRIKGTITYRIISYCEFATERWRDSGVPHKYQNDKHDPKECKIEHVDELVIFPDSVVNISQSLRCL